MIISDLKKGCRVGFFGPGISNNSLIDCLPLEKCEITLRSDSPLDVGRLGSNKNIRVLCGKDALKDINEEIIFFSPSVRRERAELQRAKERGVIFSSDAELFFEMNRCPTFVVTGSDGKSTVATMIYSLLREAGKRVSLIGNIGTPMTESLKSENDYVVCEMSSFMLRYMTPKSMSACITNITQNHLDWHESYLEYIECKKKALTRANRTVLSAENGKIARADALISIDEGYESLIKRNGEGLYITLEDGYILKNGRKILSINEIKRREGHNIKNLMMAIAMVDGLVGDEEIRRIAGSFEGLSHRCQYLGKFSGIECFDSSIDSTPARTLQTLKSLGREVVIILGGKSKGVDYSTLLPDIKKWVKYALIVGENEKEIFSAIKNDVECETFESFDRAVERGLSIAKLTRSLLLSPASTSLDSFKNYAERGDHFKELISKFALNENDSLQNIEETRKNGETNLS